MIANLLLALVLQTPAAAPAADSAKATEIVIEKVFGPELPGKYKHPAAITQLANGDLLIAYFGGSGEYEPDTRVHLTWKKKGESKWSAPVVVSENPEVPEGNPVVWQAPDGVLWLFNVARFGPTWCDSKVQARTSTDNGKTWGKPYLVSDEIGILCRSKPIVLANGNYLLPVYKETGNDPEFTGPDTSSFFFIYDPKPKKWSESSRIQSKLGNLQPAPAALTDKHIVAYCRRGGGYEGKEDGRIVRTESKDGGKTWSKGTETEFPNPNAAVDFQRLKSGHLLLVYNNSNNDRTPLSLALSTDNDKSYPHRRDIGVGDHDYAYPYLIQADDGKIHLVYTQDGRSTIMHAVFDESALTGKK